MARLIEAGTTGAFTWVQRGGDNDLNGATAVALSLSGRVYVGGSYQHAGLFGTTMLADPSTFR